MLLTCHCDICSERVAFCTYLRVNGYAPELVNGYRPEYVVPELLDLVPEPMLLVPELSQHPSWTGITREQVIDIMIIDGSYSLQYYRNVTGTGH